MRATVALLPLLLIAACSGGGGSSGASAPSPKVDAKASYLAAAEAVCARGVAAQKKLVSPTSVSAFGTYVQDLVKVAETTTDALAALTPPAADRSALQDKVLGPLKQQLSTAKAFSADVQAATRAGDQAALGRLALSPPTQPKADLAFMRSYGFSSCVDAADTSN